MGMKSTIDKDYASDLDFMENLYAMLRFMGKQVKKQSLEMEDVKSILSLMSELRSEGYSAEKYQKIYDRCRDVIQDILTRYNYCPVTPNSKLKKLEDSVNKPTTRLPVFIKILVYYMAYRAFELYDNADEVAKKTLQKPSQAGVLDYIGRMEVVDKKKVYQGYKLSNKTFTYFGISPELFYDINHYKQVALPMSYAGAKVKYLGYLINYLSAYAGSYKCFVDLFGGAGFASLAVKKQDTTKYMINEYDFFNINFYKVMADDDLYKLFIEELNKLRQIIQEQEYDEDFGKKLFERCEQEENDFREKYDKAISDELVSDFIVPSKNYNMWQNETDEHKIDAAVAFVYIHSFTVTGGKNEKGGVSETKLKRFCKYNTSEFEKLHQSFKRIDEIYNCDALDIEKEFIIEQMAKQYPKVLFYSDSPYLNTEGYEAGGIENKKMKKLIERLVVSLQGSNNFIFSCRATKSIEDSTFESVTTIFPTMKNFERDSEGNVLLDLGKIYKNFYYLNDDDVSKDVFAKIQMKKVCSLLKENQEIYKNVFCEFAEKAKEYKKELYVLVCIDKKECRKRDVDISNICDEEKVEIMVEGLFATEVFITSFDYVTPPDYHFYKDGTKNKKKALPEQEYTFVKYKLSEFCDLLKHHLFRSELYDDIEVKKEGEGYVFKI